MNTEGGRIANILSATRSCVAQDVLAKARALGNRGCKSCNRVDSTINKPVPLESSALEKKTSNCFLYQSPETGVPDSVRIAKLQQRTIDLSRDPNDPLARFSEYRRPFIEICPPIPQWYFTAGEPKQQEKGCNLPLGMPVAGE